MATVNDCIIVQTDIAFDVALDVLRQLQAHQLLEATHLQVVSIENVESNAPNDPDRFVFGGGRGNSVHFFSRTVSSVLRMCMLRSGNVPEDLWKLLGERSLSRNRDKMVYIQPQGNRFVLTADEVDASAYYSSYDHIHPYFKLEHQQKNVPPNQWWNMQPTMMLIFRNNFSEVIEFSTSLKTRYRPDISTGTYQSYVNVRCIVRRIRNTEHDSLQYLKSLKRNSSVQTLNTYEDSWKLPKDDEIEDPSLNHCVPVQATSMSPSLLVYSRHTVPSYPPRNLGSGSSILDKLSKLAIEDREPK